MKNCTNQFEDNWKTKRTSGGWGANSEWKKSYSHFPELIKTHEIIFLEFY